MASIVQINWLNFSLTIKKKGLFKRPFFGFWRRGITLLFHTNTALYCFKLFVTYAFDVFNIFNGLKRTILLSIFNNRFGGFFPDAL